MHDSRETSPGSTNRCRVCGCALPTESDDDGSCSACGYGLWFRSRKLDGLTVVDLMQDMNPEKVAIDRLSQLLLPESRTPRILLNFRQIDFVTSTFINRLIVLRRTVQDARGRLLLCGLNPVIQEIFEINRLGSLFDVFSDEQDAIGGG